MTLNDAPGKEIVLVVDDFPENLALLYDALDEAGYTVLVATAFRLKGVTCRLSAIAGIAVLMMVESSCSMNSATATTHGR